jgi:hypothetical protein
LDTNFLLGMMKASAVVASTLQRLNLSTGECAYSAVTRMELLGFPGITENEATLIKERLRLLTYLPLTHQIEDAVITLRQKRRIKLPDAMIAATALTHGLDLLTLDEGLQSVMASAQLPN